MDKLIFADYGLGDKKVFYDEKEVVGGHIKRKDIPSNEKEKEWVKTLPLNKLQTLIDQVLEDYVVLMEDLKR